MMGRIRGVLVAGLAMAASALPAIEDVPTLRWSPASNRIRFPGRARPAGSKLARKAREGRVGISTIR